MARRVNIRGERITDSMDEVRRIKLLMKQQFGLSPERAEQLFDWLQNSGWEEGDVSSVLKQTSNTYRPPLEIYYAHSTPIIRQLLANQGTWTGHMDTAAYPNFAQRNPGAAELLMRRITPGDQILLDAADQIERRFEDQPTEEYWCVVYNIIANDILRITEARGSFNRNAYAVVSAAMFVQGALCKEEYQLVASQYLDPVSPLFCGVHVSQERVRIASRYVDMTTIHEAGSEDCFKLAVNLICVAATSEHNFEQSIGATAMACVANVFRDGLMLANERPQESYNIVRAPNADQTPQDYPRPDDNRDGGTDGGGEEPSEASSPTGPTV